MLEVTMKEIERKGKWEFVGSIERERVREKVEKSRDSADPEDNTDAIAFDVNAFDDHIKMHNYGSMRKTF